MKHRISLAAIERRFPAIGKREQSESKSGCIWKVIKLTQTAAGKPDNFCIKIGSLQDDADIIENRKRIGRH